jgi:hypothetical protein
MVEEDKAWNVPDDFERHDKLNDELKHKGDVAIVKFLNDGKKVLKSNMTDETLSKLREQGVKPRDNVVFLVETKDQEKRELWLGAQNYTNLRELKAIAKGNKDTLVGCLVKVSRIAEKSPTEPNYKFEEFKE